MHSHIVVWPEIFPETELQGANHLQGKDIISTVVISTGNKSSRSSSDVVNKETQIIASLNLFWLQWYLIKSLIV